jgi:hypothetical protein
LRPSSVTSWSRCVLDLTLSQPPNKLQRTVTLAAVLTLLSVTGACTSKSATGPDPLVGAWRSTIQFETGAFAQITDLQFMYVFNAGGTLTESSNYDGAPPVPPAYGVWRMVAPSVFEARYEFFSNALPEADAFVKGTGWPPSGHGVLTERIEVSPDAQSFTSTIQYAAFGTRGEPVEGGGTARGAGVRIRFEPGR